MAKISIAGATGYTGLELIRLLVQHPEAELITLTADSHAGKNITDVAPALTGWVDHPLVKLDPSIAEECDILFLALPHTAAMEQVPQMLNGSCRIIDLSADYRLHSADSFSEWYKVPHTSAQLLEKAVYGLPELHREKIKAAQLVANPGCYPTSAILALAPLMQVDWVDLDSIIVDSKSGVSGAGRKLNLTTQFCEANEGVSAYSVAEHRHTPEIEQELSGLAGKNITLSFSPHLMPMTRGILSTVYINLKKEIQRDVLQKHYASHYNEEPFVRVHPAGQFANTHHVAGSNYCDIGVQVDARNHRAIITSAIDNLLKGASSQAVQNMNLMLGIDETTGLNTPPQFP